MSGSETGMMAAREPFSAAMQQNHNHQMASQPPMHNMRLSFSADGTAIYKPIPATSPTYQSGPAVGGESPAVPQGGETIKKKRGRPRKYGPDSTMGLALITAPPPSVGTQSGAPGFSPPAPTPAGSATATLPTTMKKRGRPTGSTNKKHLVEALGAPGTAFTPHVITVKAGEDISSKIMSFSQNGPRAVCILSANGAISNVTLRQPATSGGTVTYEGRFEILSLSGSFLLYEVGGQRSRTGGLSVSLSGPDGRVLGGGVAGLLTAASPVQVVVGSFMADGQKEVKLAHQTEVVSAAQNHTSGSLPAAVSSPPSRGTFSESSGGGGSPLNHSIGNNNPQTMSNLPWK